MISDKAEKNIQKKMTFTEKNSYLQSKEKAFVIEYQGWIMG
jgi:hypothetical protein